MVFGIARACPTSAALVPCRLYPRGTTPPRKGCAPSVDIAFTLYLDFRHDDEDDCALHGARGTWGICSVWLGRRCLQFGSRCVDRGRGGECREYSGWYVCVVYVVPEDRGRVGGCARIDGWVDVGLGE